MVLVEERMFRLIVLDGLRGGSIWKWKKRPVNFVGCNLEWNFAALAKFLARDSMKIRTEANWKNWMAEIRDNSTKAGLCWEAARSRCPTYMYLAGVYATCRW